MKKLLEIKEKKRLKLKDPWLLEKVENGVRATNIKEQSSGIKVNFFIPVLYFEYDRIFGSGAFNSAMKIIDLISDLVRETPMTRGFFFGKYEFILKTEGILRINVITKKQAFFSKQTLQNENVACYLNLVQSSEEEKMLDLIKQLDNAITNNETNRQIAVCKTE